MIEKGDKVRFMFHSGEQLFGKVLFVSPSTELIELQTYHEGKEDLIVYVREFTHVYVMEKAL